jgi:hypothetical protein
LFITHSTAYAVHGCLWTSDLSPYDLHRTLHTVHSTLYTAHCTLHTAPCTLYTVHCSLYTAHCTLYNAHCTLYSVQCTVYTRQRLQYQPIHRILHISHTADIFTSIVCNFSPQFFSHRIRKV